MSLLAPLLLPGVLGYLITSLLLGRDAASDPADRLACAFPLGMGMVAFQMFLLGLFRIPLLLGNILPLVLVEIAVMGGYLYRRRPPSSARGGVCLRGAPPPPAARWRQLLALVLGAWIVLKLGTVCYETTLRPIFAWDSWANWSARAKTFYYASNLLLGGPAGDILGRGVIDVNSNYPLFNAMSQLWMALWAGGFDEIRVKCWAPCFLVSATVGLYAAGARETSRLLALAVVAIFLSSPLLALHATEAYSDLPLAVYLLLALSSLLRVMRGRKQYLPLIGLFAFLALFTKDEALFFVIPFSISCSTFLWLQTGKQFRPAARLVLRALWPCLLIAPWFFCKSFYHLGMGADYVTATLGFRPRMLYRFFSYLFKYNNYNVVLLFLPVMWLTRDKSDRSLTLLAFPVVFYALFFLSLYVFTDFFSQRLMFETAVYRNSFTYYPCACLLLILFMRLPEASHDASRLDNAFPGATQGGE